MKLRYCSSCQRIFIADPYQRRCNDCKEIAKKKKQYSKRLATANFVPVSGPGHFQVCPTCGYANNRPNRIYCFSCGQTLSKAAS